MNKKDDNYASKFIDLCESKGFIQHVKDSTHIEGNTLDLVMTMTSITTKTKDIQCYADALQIKNLTIESDHVVSDHYLVHFQVPLKLNQPKRILKETKEYRELHNIDINQFRFDLKESPIFKEEFTSLEHAVNLYETVLNNVLDEHAPLITKSFCTNRSSWWNEHCQSARRERRRAKRKFEKHKTTESKELFNEKCVDAEVIINNARNNFYDKKLQKVSKDSRSTYKVINKLLDKEYGTDKLPNGLSDQQIAQNLQDFFKGKVDDIYDGIKKKVSGLGKVSEEDIDNNTPCFTEFAKIDENELIEIVYGMANKSCDLDIIPMWLFRYCLTELKHVVLYIVNTSLSTGCFPDSFKAAIVRPSLKKVGTDPDELKNYRPISNLSYLSKIVEKVVHKQLTAYIESENLLPCHQSGYRKFHSCETAVTKIHNDILMMMDKQSNVVLLLLDLSAAFDTINHSLLLQKLQNTYGIKGCAKDWLKSYLINRKFSVNVKRASSSSYVLEIGVPQGSILGPLLFILYTKDIQHIVSKYGFSVHLYADDTQVYFAFDVHCTNPDMTSIKKCFKEIKEWMLSNFLKLNEDKTEFIDIGYYKSPLSSITLDEEELSPILKAKNLGFHFDHRMSLDDQVTTTQQACNIQLRNLKRIARHLSYELKIQLIHSCVLSHLDYCNSTYGSLTENNLQKLQKIQNDAVRFIFNINGKNKYESISPYLKKLHFLPVRFRIKFKTALLVFKCINNLAPSYLSELVNTRNINSHNLRIDMDFFLLSTPPAPNLKTTSAAFSYNGPQIWNSLPYSIRCISEINAFKTRLKTYYFEMAFS